MLLAQALRIHVDPHVGSGHEADALGPHLLETPVEDALLHLELGDAVAQQAADPVGALEHRDVVAGAAELLGGRQAGGPGSDDRDALPGPDGRGLGRRSSPRRTRGRRSGARSALIVTGSSLIPRTQEPSHGAGQSVPVNSGKLFVAWSRSMASRQSSR